MDIATAFWMVIFVGVILGPFLYFANLAFSNEKGEWPDSVFSETEI